MENKENRPPRPKNKNTKNGGKPAPRKRVVPKKCSCKLFRCIVEQKWDKMWEVVEVLKCSGGSGFQRRLELFKFFATRLAEAGRTQVSVPRCVESIVHHHFPTEEDAWYD